MADNDDRKNDAALHAGRRISFSEAITVSLNALSSNKLRSSLTMLGIIIGVGAMITMVALGTGAKMAVENRILSLGANLLFVRAGSPSQGHVHGPEGETENLMPADADALRKNCPSITAVVPEVSSSYQVKYENQNWNTRVTGTTPDYEWVRNASVSKGEYFSNADDLRRERVCVIGQTVVDNLFGDTDPIGRTIKMRGINFTVKGVLAEKGIQGWFNQDDQILIPVQTAMYRVMGRDSYSSISLRVRSDNLMDAATIEVESALRREHRLREGQENDFSVRSMSDVASTLGEATQTFTVLLASIALVSLVVGGIGIMNIMLVSVTERTREIGIRLSIGARGRDVLLQFLVESIVLSTLGGLFGMALGLGGSYAAARALSLPFPILPTIIFVAVAFSAAVGVGFGYYPARKAARLNPIEALRHE